VIGLLGVLYSLYRAQACHETEGLQAGARGLDLARVFCPRWAYAALAHSGFALRHESADTIYVVGAASLLLMFIGIHNAWDTVTYLTLVLRESGPEGGRGKQRVRTGRSR
jgi:hypothetical protein